MGLNIFTHMAEELQVLVDKFNLKMESDTCYLRQ